MRPIPERANVTAEIFHNEILPAAKPVVFRQLAPDWPVVRAGITSPQALTEYIRRFDRGNSVSTMYGPPSIKGRFFYNDDISGFNFQSGVAKFASAFDYMLQYGAADPPPALAVQSVPTRVNLPGFEEDNPLPLLRNVEPRIWVGTAGIVAAHYDPSENIAVAVCGKRRFTLFAPDQVGNLYPGPWELTPAGTIISMVDFDEPDFERYPKFRDAIEAAQTTDLEPGDAIYIPYLWWHHVRSRASMNMLVNYWWAPPSTGRGSPRDVLYHGMMTLKDLPPAHAQAWRALFDHFVFKDNGEPLGHLAPERRGIAGDADADMVRKIRTALVTLLQRSS